MILSMKRRRSMPQMTGQTTERPALTGQNVGSPVCPPTCKAQACMMGPPSNDGSLTVSGRERVGRQDHLSTKTVPTVARTSSKSGQVRFDSSFVVNPNPLRGHQTPPLFVGPPLARATGRCLVFHTHECPSTPFWSASCQLTTTLSDHP